MSRVYAKEGRSTTSSNARDAAPASGNGGTPTNRLLPYLLDSVYLGSLALTTPYLACAGRGGLLIDHVRRQTQDSPLRTGNRPCVWVHGVSVGEILSARSLLKKFSDEYPDWDIVLSTTTRAGIEAGKKHYPDRQVISFPFDMSFLVRRAFDRIRPDLVMIVEHELWPNFLGHAESRGVPVVIVNARLSERSRRGYRWLSRLMTWPPRGVVQICAEDETSARGFRELGVDECRVRVTGNIKFDNTLETPPYQRSELGLRPDDWVLMAGSTHPGEEELLLDAFCRLREDEPRSRLILAPRRVERTPEIRRLVERRGLELMPWSSVSRDSGFVSSPPAGGNGLNGHALATSTGGAHSGLRRELRDDQVLLIDTVGELHGISGTADVVFVGGSLVPFGGHNIIEPASLGCAVVIGPHHRNFRQVVASFKNNDALAVVETPDELLATLRDLQQNREKAIQLGQRAAATVARNSGASQRTFEAVRPLVEELSQRRRQPDAAAGGR